VKTEVKQTQQECSHGTAVITIRELITCFLSSSPLGLNVFTEPTNPAKQQTQPRTGCDDNIKKYRNSDEFSAPN
jgi:spore coat protein CotF